MIGPVELTNALMKDHVIAGKPFLKVTCENR
jgi:hypothetical protein